jgi:spore coat polysaccharide biosynthesis protein SpsF
MRTAIILQARMGSTRFPQKVMKPIQGKPMIQLQIERLMAAEGVDEIILATTVNPSDDILCDLAKELKINYYRGSELDVLDRFYRTADLYSIDNIVRCNADCPLIDPLVVSSVINAYKNNLPNYDYVSNILIPSFPVGMHTEIFKFEALKEAHHNSVDPLEREHVTPYIYRRANIFSLNNISCKTDLSSYRLTVDYEVDFMVVKKIFDSLYSKNKLFGMYGIIQFLNDNPKIKAQNSFIEKKSTV